MPKAKVGVSTKKLRTPISPENREGQLVSLATDLAEQQLRDGTASSQVIVHYLKLGTAKAKLEREKLEQENKLLEAKTKSYESNEELKTMYTEVIDAIRTYNGYPEEADDYEEC